jgi:hypothetical protein
MLVVAGVTRRGVLTVLTLGLLMVAATAGARSPQRWLPEPPPAGIALEDATGSALPVFYHEGRTFVLGEPGERYVVRITNPTSERVEAVVSVDGRDAISGRVADYRAQRGYIVPPYGSVTIDGFRQSLSAVAAFRFASPEDSYSARMGTPENVGIVGVALFSERKRKAPASPVARLPRPSPRYDADRPSGDSEPGPDRAASKRRSAESAPPAPAKGAAESRGRGPAPRDSVDNLGTEYGETRESSVVEVAFERASSRPMRVLNVRYDDADGLRARGIDVRPRWSRRAVDSGEPEAFPNSRFAQPPP